MDGTEADPMLQKGGNDTVRYSNPPDEQSAARRFMSRACPCCSKSGGATINQTPAERRRCHFGKDNVLLVFTVVSVLIGVCLGLGLRRYDDWNVRTISYLKFPGEIFLRMLKMCILPLIVASLISSLAGLESSTAGRMGGFAVLYYFTTTMCAVVLGIILVLAIKPGSESSGEDKEEDTSRIKCVSQAVDTILDLFRNLFPENLVEATFRTLSTCNSFYNGTNVSAETAVPLKEALALNQSERMKLQDVPTLETKDGMNILGLVMFSVIFGLIISRMEEDGAPLRNFFRSLEGAMMKIISLVIWYSPIGITFLIAAQIVEMADVVGELKKLTYYMITVLTGLAIHALITLPALLFIFTRRNPLKFVYGMLQALLTALGTSSSSATLPLSIKCLEENNGIDSRVARFVMPLGATINMDGTALYEAVAAIFIAQSIGRTLSIGQVILVSMTATLASIGAAGIPQAGVVTMIMVLIAVGLPTQYFILIMPVDWFLDRIRTTVNVHGDSIGAGIVQKLCEKQLREMDEAHALEMQIATQRTNDIDDHRQSTV